MCYNLNPSGSTDGSSDNLESWNWDQHAVYLANVAQYAATHWGFKFTSVEAFNEPSATYWVGPTGTQEGWCVHCLLFLVFFADGYSATPAATSTCPP
jgi:galactan endo-1,6-beta-galactosidase